MMRWYLQEAQQDSHTLHEIPLNPLPQILGREPNLHCVVNGPTVSRNHARLEQQGKRLVLTDLGSSNGTFVNRQRIMAPTVVDHGDIIHLGSTELRLIQRSLEEEKNFTQSNTTRFMGSAELSGRIPAGLRDLEDLIAHKSVKIVYQPIIRANDLACVGYEALCRGASTRLPTNPMELFTIAESFNLAAQLSEMLREQALNVAEQFHVKGDLLINTHPSEVTDPERLLADMRSLRERHPNRSITLEIHEHAVTDDGDLLAQMKLFLNKLNIKLAFDDFGVGQSRLMEMIEAKPDLIKFDKKLIENIDTAESTRVKLIDSLLQFAKELNINCLAECVGTEAEYQTCAKMGFEYYQGFYFAKPQPPEQL